MGEALELADEILLYEEPDAVSTRVKESYLQGTSLHLSAAEVKDLWTSRWLDSCLDCDGLKLGRQLYAWCLHNGHGDALEKLHVVLNIIETEARNKKDNFHNLRYLHQLGSSKNPKDE